MGLILGFIAGDVVLIVLIEDCLLLVFDVDAVIVEGNEALKLTEFVLEFSDDGYAVGERVRKELGLSVAGGSNARRRFLR